MGLYDDRGNSSFPRWGVDGSGTLDADVVEPPTGQKNTGWEPALDKPPAEWFNWLHFSAYFATKYLENLFKGILPYGFLPIGNSNPSTALEVTDPGVAGLTLDVAAGRAWVKSGAMAELETADTVTLDTADGTNDRIDVVVLDVSGGTTVLTKVTGTPAATPSAPSLTDDQIPLAEVLVGAGVTELTSGDITDVRRFAPPVPANAEEYNTAVTQILTICPWGMVANDETRISTRSPTGSAPIIAGSSGEVYLMAPVDLPHGARVTEIAVTSDHDATGGNTDFFLQRRELGSSYTLATLAQVNKSDSTGSPVRSNSTSITNGTIDTENYAYRVYVRLQSTVDIRLFSLEIHYELDKPITPI